MNKILNLWLVDQPLSIKFLPHTINYHSYRIISNLKCVLFLFNEIIKKEKKKKTKFVIHVYREDIIY
ncbi:hypothetical protein PFAG_00036 [Plasmodium falciparum Santa Lucia]|uniref:Uncharacterized protein n=2 Tax=Plasmodium falciparum TaxID=5833 RepID=A0A024WFC9_PLAFA|nr:hypothetical protein PFTANZ_00060 [Plasmodium falciparum Tanzania (2000708)]EUT94375.1 hypothetical protein PFAG_00036 [Plasmodium falciparum Santa Lucia]